MKRWLSLLFLLWGVGSVLADGLIIVHDVISMPRPWPPPLPGPRPPIHPPPPRHYPFAPLEVVYHHVEVRIRDQVAVTRVDQEFYNPNDRQLEGTYLFPVPKGAQIDKFTMDIAGKQVAAELLPAEKARQIYEDIVRKSLDPALLEYAGRDVFKVRVFPIEPRSKKRIQLAYTQLLRADSGLLGYLYPLNTEKFSAKPIPSVTLKVDLETKRPLKSIYSPSHSVDIRRDGPTKATIRFEAKDVRPDTDFQLFYSAETDRLGLNLMAYRTGSDEGYFVLLAAPGLETRGDQVSPKDVVFVLDTSGSMAGKKLDQAKQALLFCVENLNAVDRFEVIRFASDTERLFSKLVEAQREPRGRAADFIRGLKPTGGTAIDQALREALALRPGKADRPFLVIFLTDGLPTVGETDADRIVAGVNAAASGHTRVFCFGIGHDVNTRLLDQITEHTRAASQYVLPEEDLEVKVSNFFTKIKDPALTNLKLVFPEGVRLAKIHPSPLPDLFTGDQLVVAGRYSGVAKGEVILEGTVRGEPRRFPHALELPAQATEYEFIPRLWAMRRIGHLLDEIRLRGESAELRDEVTDLAKQHGIVTPYTAFLIHEDETRREVPLAMQSFPGLAYDQEAYEASRLSYESLKRDVSGPGAVAAARYGLAQKSALQVDAAMNLARVEAGRALAAATPASPATATATAAPSRGRVGAPVLAPAATRLAEDVSRKVLEYTQQSRFVGGRTFFLNGDQWIDSQVQKLKAPPRVRLVFNSREYFDLLAKEPPVRPWLALGQSVQFAWGGKVYDVVASGP